MIYLEWPDGMDFINSACAALHYAVFFRKLYREASWREGGTAVGMAFLLYLTFFGMTVRKTYHFVLLIHGLWCAGCAIVLHRQLRIQKQYAVFLAVIFVLIKGIWNRQLIVFLIPAAERVTGICWELVNMGLTIATLYLVQRFVVRIEKERTIGWSEVFAGLFPACATFMARIGIYHYIYYLQEMNRRQAVTEFTGIGAFLAFSTMVSVGASEKYFAYIHNRHELELAGQQLQLQYAMFKEQRRSDEVLKRVYHDMANHMSVLEEMADLESVQEYIREISGRVRAPLEDIDTGNSTVNLLLRQKRQACEDRGLVLEAAVFFGPADFLNPMEICTLFANCIDNAMEAVERDAVADRTIQIRGGVEHGCLVVCFENAYDHALHEEGDSLKSSKAGGVHGYGLRNVRSVLERHDGALSIQTEGGRFVLTFMIPLPA